MKKSSMFNTFVDIIQKKYDVDFFFFFQMEAVI